MYFYNGNTIEDLFVKNGKRKMGLIPTDDGDSDVKSWFDFLVADKSDSGSGETELPPVIGYSSYYDKIIVCDDLGHNSNVPHSPTNR